MIANVHNGAHFVLAYDGAGDGKNIKVQDPGYNVDKYAVNDIVGWVKLKIAKKSELEKLEDELWEGLEEVK